MFHLYFVIQYTRCIFLIFCLPPSYSNTLSLIRSATRQTYTRVMCRARKYQRKNYICMTTVTVETHTFIIFMNLLTSHRQPKQILTCTHRTYHIWFRSNIRADNSLVLLQFWCNISKNPFSNIFFVNIFESVCMWLIKFVIANDSPNKSILYISVKRR